VGGVSPFDHLAALGATSPTSWERDTLSLTLLGGGAVWAPLAARLRGRAVHSLAALGATSPTSWERGTLSLTRPWKVVTVAADAVIAELVG
jgi:hypothetical protein